MLSERGMGANQKSASMASAKNDPNYGLTPFPGASEVAKGGKSATLPKVPRRRHGSGTSRGFWNWWNGFKNMRFHRNFVACYSVCHIAT